MSCTSCAASIEKTLEKIEGIEIANVNFATEKVTIEYDSEKIRLTDIQEKISDIGYELVVEETEDDNIDEDEIRIKKAEKIMKISLLCQ